MTPSVPASDQLVLARDRRTQEALHHAALAVSRADGDGLVQALTRYLATILRTDQALIGVLEGEEDERRVRTIGLYGDGVYLENYEYRLQSTPCRTVLDGFRCYPTNVRDQFPDSRVLRKANIDSYAGYPLRGSDGRLLGVIAVLSRRPLEDEALIESVLEIFAGRAAGEIERRRAEDALRTSEASYRESEEQYRSIFNASVDGLLLWDSSAKVVDVNEAFLRMHGFSREDLLGGDCERFLPEKRRDDCKRIVRAALDGNAYSGETVALRYDGSIFDVEVHVVPMPYRNQPHVLSIVRDLTERRREEKRRAQLEAQLRQAQKMEAIGHLTGGIAHDFNNLLASIMGYVVLASERHGRAGDAKLAQYLQQAQHSCERARNLIRQMLTFSRGQRGEPRPVALAASVREAAKLLRASFPATVEMHAELDVELPAVLIDPVQLEQVLMNLCINARDAMHAVGAVRVATSWRSGWRGVCTSCRQSVEGDFVELSVGDTGPGIDADVLDRMFEPFFSTKEVGKGSGMGLATVHGIVHEHNGHIVVETQTGRGSTFRVLLPPLGPAISGDDPHASLPAAPEAQRPALDARIVLVDDEASVLAFMRELLESWGLRVSAFFDAEDARRQIDDAGFEFDLLIADQTMPRLTGTELAHAAARARPGLPILLYTGYRDAVESSDVDRAGIRAVLEKPVDADVLYQQLRQNLGSRRAA